MKKRKRETGTGDTNYREIFEKAIDGIFILEIETGKIIDTNRKAAAITGYSIAELIGGHPADVSSINPYYTRQTADEKIKLAATEGKQIFEWEIKRKDETITCVEVHCTVADIGGEARVIGFFHEIDDRKRAEALLQKSEANLRTIFNHTEIAFVLLDSSFNILSCNEIANRWAELSVGVGIKEGDNFISLIRKDQQYKSLEVLRSVIAGNAVDHETYYTLKDGTTEWYRVRNNPVRDNNGRVIGICVSAANISFRKFSEIESQKLTEDLIQRNKDLEQFAYIVSHNLRAPIANIIGITDVMYTMNLEREEEKQMTRELMITVKQLDMVIKDLNFVLQIKQNINEKKQIVSLPELLKNIQLSIDHLIRKEKVIFLTDFSQAGKMLTLKSYLHSIFFNLISNSIKYRQPEIVPVLKITSSIKENKIILLFKDNGLGIDLEKKGGQVFGLYKRFHSHVEGKGMGLFMVKTQVEALGGKISMKSEVKKGTEFMIEFENDLKQ